MGLLSDIGKVAGGIGSAAGLTGQGGLLNFKLPDFLHGQWSMSHKGDEQGGGNNNPFDTFAMARAFADGDYDTAMGMLDHFSGRRKKQDAAAPAAPVQAVPFRSLLNYDIGA